MLPGMIQTGFFIGGTASLLPTYIGGAQNGSDQDTPDYTVDLSSISILQNDLILVATGNIANGTSSANITCSGNNSGAYTANIYTSDTSDVWDCSFKTYLKIAGATPDTSLSIGRGGASTTYGGHTAVHVWRNINTGTPQDVATVEANGGNTGRGNPPSITPTTAGSIIIACGMGAQPNGGSAFTVPSGMLNGVSGYTDGTTSGAGTWIASDVWVSGAYDPAAWTGGSDSANASWVAQTLALRPA
jgi:hypothetical protein